MGKADTPARQRATLFDLQRQASFQRLEASLERNQRSAVLHSSSTAYKSPSKAIITRSINSCENRSRQISASYARLFKVKTRVKIKAMVYALDNDPIPSSLKVQCASQPMNDKSYVSTSSAIGGKNKITQNIASLGRSST